MTVIQLVKELLNTGKYYNEVLIELDDGKIFEVNGIEIDSQGNTVLLED